MLRPETDRLAGVPRAGAGRSARDPASCQGGFDTADGEGAQMKAIVYERTGDASVLRLVERPVPEPGPGEVLVRLAVSGVNPTDWKSRQSWPLPAGWQTPGQDGAGVIEAVGAGVDQTLIGERVWVWEAAWQRPWGTAAEYTVVPVRQAVPLGDASFELGASLGIPFLTAHRCLTVGETMPDAAARRGRWPTVRCWCRAGRARSATRRSSSPGWADATRHRHGEQPGEGAAGGGGRRVAW